MEQFKLTPEIMKGAKTYLSVAEKADFVEENAKNCFDRLLIEDESGEKMPPMYKINASLKARYLMYALAALYLRQSVEVESPCLLTEQEYDKYAGSHVLMQIERLKKTAEESVKSKCFDLQSDFRLLEHWFNDTANGYLAVQNDVVVRQQALTKAMMAELPATLEQLKELIKARETKEAAEKGGEAVISYGA